MSTPTTIAKNLPIVETRLFFPYECENPLAQTFEMAQGYDVDVLEKITVGSGAILRMAEGMGALLLNRLPHHTVNDYSDAAEMRNVFSLKQYRHLTTVATEGAITIATPDMSVHDVAHYAEQLLHAFRTTRSYTWPLSLGHRDG